MFAWCSGKVSMGGRTIIYMRFVDDIDAQENQELEALAESLD